jgi:hypothetical protein
MGLRFGDVVLFVFDMHVTPSPLQDDSLLRSPFRFLANPTGFRDAFATQTVIQGLHFEVRPLSRRDRIRNRFWRAFLSVASQDGNPDVWQQQAPFFASSPTLELSPHVQTWLGLGVADVAVKGSVVLWAWGWSTQLEIRLRGDLDCPRLSAIVGSLRDPGVTPFVLRTGAVGVSSVFSHFAKLVRQELFEERAEPSITLAVARHFVISPLSFEDPSPQPYRRGSSKSNSMPDAARADLHSILQGRSVDLPELVALEEGSEFLLTQFGSGVDFALSYFNRGTLILMQGPGKLRTLRKLYCLASNIRTCTMMAMGLTQLRVRAATFESPGRVTTDLQRGASHTLRELPRQYRNAFCQNWLAHNRSI